LLKLLPECVENLGDSARQAVRMHYKRRMRLKTIGETLGRSLGAVKLLMFRARKALRKCLDEKLGQADVKE
jgi:RNA polymerase sigma-70 factor (ECF subfamily)